MSPEWNEMLFRALLEPSIRVAIFAAIVALILRTVRIRSSSVIHAAWTSVLLAMLFMPVLPHLVPSIPIPISIPAAAARGDARILDASAPPAVGLHRDAALALIRGLRHESSFAPGPERKPMWPFALMTLYLIGAMGLLSRALWGWLAMLRIERECRPVAPDTLLYPERMKMRTPVYESEMAAAPLTAGIISPRIILPLTWRKWRPEKLNAVLAHELSHVRRRDTLVASLSHLNRCLFWFHPLAWWLERKLAATAELACDDDAIRAIGEKRLYAGVLLDMAQAVRRRGGRLAWHGIGVHGNGFLGQRIDRLLRGNLFCETSGIRKTVVAFGCAAAIFLVAACRQKPQTATPRENPKSAMQQVQRRNAQSLWAKRLRIFTDPVNAPFEFGSGTGVQGLDVEIGDEIGKNLGIGVKWVKAPGPGSRQNRLKLVVDYLLDRSFSDVSLSNNELLFELLKKGEAEILISAIAIDPRRAADVEFSKPYYDTGDIIARQRSRLDITDLASLSGRKVGVTAGRPAEAFMATQKTAAGVLITKYSTMDDALGALNRGEIDAVVGDEPLITYGSIRSFHNTTPLPTLINKYQYAVVVQRGRKELLAKINATIDRMKSAGELKKLDETWLGNVRTDAVNLFQKDLEVERLTSRNLSAAASPR